MSTRTGPCVTVLLVALLGPTAQVSHADIDVSLGLGVHATTRDLAAANRAHNTGPTLRVALGPGAYARGPFVLGDLALLDFRAFTEPAVRFSHSSYGLGLGAGYTLLAGETIAFRPTAGVRGAIAAYRALVPGEVHLALEASVRAEIEIAVRVVNTLWFALRPGLAWYFRGQAAGEVRGLHIGITGALAYRSRAADP